MGNELSEREKEILRRIVLAAIVLTVVGIALIIIFGVP